MICASVMLAIFLAWPLVFGRDGPRGIETAAEAHVVAMIPVPTAKRPAPAAPKPTKPESCYNRFQRAVKQCTGRDTAACKMGAADHWDMCEATGFWPD